MIIGKVLEILLAIFSVTVIGTPFEEQLLTTSVASLFDLKNKVFKKNNNLTPIEIESRQFHSLVFRGF